MESGQSQLLEFLPDFNCWSFSLLALHLNLCNLACHLFTFDLLRSQYELWSRFYYVNISFSLVPFFGADCLAFGSSCLCLDSDTIHKDLAELTCDISIKGRLIEDLERSLKNMHSMRQHYEEKLQQLQARIMEIEVERDTILGSMGELEFDWICFLVVMSFIGVSDFI